MFNLNIENRSLKAEDLNYKACFNANIIHGIQGKVGIPILLYFLGVPGIVVLVLWAIFFRG